MSMRLNMRPKPGPLSSPERQRTLFWLPYQHLRSSMTLIYRLKQTDYSMINI
ncbi:hypothetical protein HanIR_Chr02g0059611 [Helianthus annuus]|nr:hypothetical protein HanIR_Chr02g0059611 [Helianthus annuus]